MDYFPAMADFLIGLVINTSSAKLCRGLGGELSASMLGHYDAGLRRGQQKLRFQEIVQRTGNHCADGCRVSK